MVDTGDVIVKVISNTLNHYTRPQNESRIGKQSKVTMIPTTRSRVSLINAPFTAAFGIHAELKMNSHQEDKWSYDYSIETSASPEVIWRIFSDVPGWKKWNAGIEQIEMRGPFAVGAEFMMTPPGQEPLLTRLIEVRENEAFVDETRVGDLVIAVAHRIERLGAHRTKVTYAVEARGPGCDEVGPAVSSDFPDVLKSLVKLAESKT